MMRNADLIEIFPVFWRSRNLANHPYSTATKQNVDGVGAPAERGLYTSSWWMIMAEVPIRPNSSTCRSK